MGPELTCRFEPSREMPGRRTRWPCWLLSRGRAAALPLAPLLLAARCLPPRTVALIRQTALAGFLTLRRIGHCVVVVQVVGPAPACLDGLLRWPRRDQAVAGVADHVGPPSLAEGFLDCEVILQPTGRLAYVNSERAAFGQSRRVLNANSRRRVGHTGVVSRQGEQRGGRIDAFLNGSCLLGAGAVGHIPVLRL